MQLTDIKGIGTKTARDLARAGINTVAELAQIDDPSSYEVEPDWIEQARALIAGNASDERTEPGAPNGADRESSATASPATVESPTEKISFTLTSGAHRGKIIHWKVGDPAMMVGRAGTYLGLANVGVTAINTDQGITRFRFTWGETVSGAELPAAQYRLLSDHIKKNASPSIGAVTVTQNSGVVSRVVNSARTVAARTFGGGCANCGQ